MRTAHALYSAVSLIGSKALLVTMLMLASRKWKHDQTTPRGERSVTQARIRTRPRRETTQT